MTTERAFSCGNSKYYVAAYFGYFMVERQDWFWRTHIGFARDLAGAMTLIHRDAKAGRIRAA